MSNTIGATLVEAATARRRALRERGLTTVEYALGVVVVIVIIGAVIVAIQTGSFQGLLDALIKAIMEWITGAFDLQIPWVKS